MTINKEEFEDFVYLEALKNAVSYNGKANPKALIGKVMPKFSEMKNDMSHYMNEINNICNQVNELDVNLQSEKLKELDSDFFDKKKEKTPPKKTDGLPNLPDTDKPVVVRMEPAPSGHMHLGHLFPIVANYEFKKKYKGKFIIRIADTNPDNIDIANYDKVIEDIKWVCDNNVDKIYYQSDRLDLYYKYLRMLVETGNAYICKCDSDTFKAYTDAKEQCPCAAEMTVETQIKKYDKMFSGRYKPGEAVVRFKADITHKNPAMRSFSLARINTNEHARVGKKYSVWPTMHLAVAIDDVDMGITHVIRGKDHEINMERQMLVHKALGMKSPHYFHIGRMKFEDINLSKTDLTKKIEEGIYEGWDDPRVPSLLAYKKRGYKAEAFRNFILSLGISKRDSKITSEEYHKGLDYFNKQILEKESDRFFFVHNPKKVKIENIEKYPQKEIILPKHPEDKSKGNRHFKLTNEYLIDSLDFSHFEKGDLIRLMHFGNFLITKIDKDTLHLEFKSKDFDRNLGIKRNIHFVPTDAQECVMVMQNNEKIKGLTEDLDNIKEDTSVQFERFGFARFDRKNKEGKRVFYFTHR